MDKAGSRNLLTSLIMFAVGVVLGMIFITLFIEESFWVYQKPKLELSEEGWFVLISFLVMIIALIILRSRLPKLTYENNKLLKIKLCAYNFIATPLLLIIAFMASRYGRDYIQWGMICITALFAAVIFKIKDIMEILKD